MKRNLFILLLAGLGAVVLQQAAAQRAKKPIATPPVKATAKIPEIETTLGNSGMSGGQLSKEKFDQLLKQGIRLSAPGKIQGFNFTYAERNHYEDSAGNPIVVMDYLIEYCLGDSISPGIKSSIFDRTKPGDTAYFDDIKVLLPTNASGRGKPMKFAIVGVK